MIYANHREIKKEAIRVKRGKCLQSPCFLPRSDSRQFINSHYPILAIRSIQASSLVQYPFPLSYNTKGKKKKIQKNCRIKRIFMV